MAEARAMVRIGTDPVSSDCSVKRAWCFRRSPGAGQIDVANHALRNRVFHILAGMPLRKNARKRDFVSIVQE